MDISNIFAYIPAPEKIQNILLTRKELLGYLKRLLFRPLEVAGSLRATAPYSSFKTFNALEGDVGKGLAMCLGIPGQVTQVDGTSAKVLIRGHESLADSKMVAVQAGDFVLVYAGLIVQILDPEEAEERLRLLQEAGV